MAKQPRKSSPSLINVPTPGTLAFADGGAVRQESADELMARMAAKYGVPAAGKVQSGPAQPPAQQPQPKTQARPEQQGISSGIVGILKGRAAQIDKAAGYAEGGKISGPGTPKSDSVRATIRETGEGIRVSNGERIVSAEQDKFLEDIAKAAGYESLDAMLEDGTGKPVGPTIKAGKRAAADGLAPELDPFAYRGGPAAGITTAPGAGNRIKGAIAAPPTLGAAPFARSEPDGALTNPAAGGITIDPIGPKPEPGGSGQTGIGPLAAPGLAASKVGRDASGIITAESAQAAAGSDMQRSGGVFGMIDLKGGNEILARENKARGEMIDLSIKASGGNGVAVLPDYQPPQQGGISISDIQSAMKSAGTRTERAAYGQALQTMLAGQN
ncbi:hypothetical protein [Azonexus sp.]|uniref:hypothetical protein n=1 Tax=Azonexus sp. TaxID=1872668 RepID=UPI0035AE6CBA